MHVHRHEVRRDCRLAEDACVDVEEHPIATVTSVTLTWGQLGLLKGVKPTTLP